MTPLVEVLTRTSDYLRERGVASPRLDAEILIGHVLGLDRVATYLQFDRPLTEAELAALRPLVKRRGAREPLAWITGRKEFHGQDFVVKPGVLVPRPDTETLVDAALAALGDDDPVYVADVGCGTGCIGIALALAKPGVRVYALDRDEVALATTRENVERHGLKDRVAVRRADLMSGVPADRPIDWVLANPPYIPTGEFADLAPEVRDHEPRGALDGGADGLDVYRRLLPEAVRRARRGVLVEVGAGQADAVAAMMPGTALRHRDLAGIERVVGIRNMLSKPSEAP